MKNNTKFKKKKNRQQKLNEIEKSTSRNKAHEKCVQKYKKKRKTYIKLKLL